MKTINLPYTIERNNRYFLAYIDQTMLNALHLPVNLRDELCSVSFTVSDYSKTGEEFCLKLSKIFKEYWKLDYGIPIVSLSGDLNKFDDVYKVGKILIFFLTDKSKAAEQALSWRNATQFLSRFTFIAFSETSGSSVVTKEHRVAQLWLEQFIQTPAATPKNRYDLRKVMHDWYLTDDLDKKLIEAADAAITSFVYARKYDREIPGSLVVPVYHYIRYEKAVKILNALYGPKFIMSLPLQIENQEYTVLFPVMKND